MVAPSAYCCVIVAVWSSATYVITNFCTSESSPEPLLVLSKFDVAANASAIVSYFVPSGPVTVYVYPGVAKSASVYPVGALIASPVSPSIVSLLAVTDVAPSGTSISNCACCFDCVNVISVFCGAVSVPSFPVFVELSKFPSSETVLPSVAISAVIPEAVVTAPLET